MENQDDHLASADDGAARQCGGWGAALAVLVSCAYYGFLFAGAYSPKQLAAPAAFGVPWSFLLGASLLIFIVLITGLYVLISNRAEARS